ncbi:MAG TPA: amino acid adenylation domain-containing protein [Anaerolineaceae bacterium]
MENTDSSFPEWKELTCSQNQIYLSDVYHGPTPVHNLTFAYAIDGPVQPEVFRRAFDRLVEEAGCLRLQIAEFDGRARQTVLPQTDLALQVIDFSTHADPNAAYRGWVDELGHLPMNLEKLVIGAWLAQVDPRRAYWVITLHHVIADSWGIYLLYKRLVEIYRSLLLGQDPTAGALPPYEQLLDADMAYLNSAEFRADQIFWRETLDGCSGRVDLYGYSGSGRVAPVCRVHHRADPALAHRLLQRMQEPAFAGHTVNVSALNLLLTTFAAYLYRVSGQRDFMISVPYLNRPGQLREIPGLTIQAEPVCIHVEPGDTFLTLFERVRAESARVAQHSRYPIPNPDNQLYNVMLNFHNRLLAGGAEMVETWWFNETETIDFAVNLLNPDLETGQIEFGFDISERLIETIGSDAIIQQFMRIFAAMLHDPHSTIDGAPLLTPAERRDLLGGVDAVQIPNIGRLFTQAFPEQVSRAPDAVALKLGTRQLTYRELDRRTDALAAILRQNGVQPGTPVGMLLQERFDMVIGLVGIMKSGGLYVPLDPTYPDERLEYMLQDAGIGILVTEPLMEARSARFAVRKINIHTLPDAPAGFAPHIPAWDDPGYITYTSGSTGRPKGVVTSHGSLANDTAAMRDYLKLVPGDHFLFFAAIGFDAAFEEILPALICGATVIPRPGGLLSSAEFSRLLRNERISVMSIPAAFWSEWTAGMLLNEQAIPPDLVKMMIYAEEPNIQSFIAWCGLPGAEHVRWINTYGPTEAAITTTMFEPSPTSNDAKTWSRFPIGLPLPNHSVYVLDENRELVARGVPGELYIGGDVALRYQNMPAESAAVFLPDPFRAEPGSRMYKTGDRVRWLPSGQLEFLGRIDNQVKLHGFRIELGEIEARLAEHPTVRQAVVLIKGQPGATQRLVAYVVPVNSHLNAGDVTEFLRKTLPAYMLPSDFVTLAQFPVTPNGKIDKKALPDPGAEVKASTQDSVPATNMEIELVNIWQDVLGIAPIGVNQNYFDLGGNSLLGVRIFSRLESKLGLRLPVSELYRSPTIRQLAHFIESREYNYQPSTVILLRGGQGGLPLFLVHGWGGGVVGYANLVHSLNPHWPVYGLQAAGLGQGEKPDTTMEAMVDRYIRAMKTIQPAGPYRLGGYCTGGVIAYAIACELAARGDVVDLIAMIEGEPPHIERENPGLFSRRRMNDIVCSIPFWMKDYADLGFTGIRQRVLQLARKVQREWEFRNTPVEYMMDDIILDDDTPLPDFQKDLLLKQVQMMEHYHPRRFAGPLSVYIARYPTIMSALNGPLDDTLGWEQLVDGPITTHWINSSHRNIHLPPHCADLAAAIEADLRAADRTHQASQAVGPAHAPGPSAEPLPG